MLAKACAERPQSMRAVRLEVEALRERAWSSASTGGRLASEPIAPERTPFVGRETETAELSRLLDRMLMGQGSCVFIGGEPGVGKTRLAQEIIARARQRGCLCLAGHCYEMEGAPPFVPFVEITEEAVRLVPQAVRAAMGDGAAEIASVVPSLRRSYADIPELPDLPVDQRRRLVFNAFLEWMRRAGQKSPSVLLFDDLQWADESTLQLLTHVAPHLSSLRMLVVATYRDVELDVVRPFARTLEALLRQRLATRIALRRLDASGVAQMLASLGGSAPPSGLAKAVFQETEGNPFFVEEVYQHLAEEGKLFEAAGQWKADLRVDTIEVPESVRLVVGRRLDRLGERARKVLTAAAVIGRTFPLDVLQGISELSEDDVIDAIEEAERAQLVSLGAGRRTVRYAFVHELIRTTLVSGLSLPRRQRLHLRIADAIERSRSFTPEGQASVLAHHLYQAGAAADAERTAAALAFAGRAAQAAGAFDESLHLFDDLLGLELADEHPLTAEALEYRGIALAGLHRDDDALHAFEQGLARHTAARNDAGIARLAGRAVENLLWRVQFAAAAELLDRALASVSAGGSRERALLHAWFGSVIRPDTLETSWTHIEQARVIAEEIADAALLSHVLVRLTDAERECAEIRGGIEAGQRAMTLGVTDGRERVQLLMSLVLCHYYAGHFAEADRLLEELAPAARRVAAHGALWVHERLVSGIALARSGDIRAYHEASRQAARVPHFQYVSRTHEALSALYLGRVDFALEELADIVRNQPAEHFFAGVLEANVFAAHALVGHIDIARRAASAVEPLLPKTGRRNVHGAYQALDAFVIGLATLGAKDRCAALYPSTLDSVKTGLRYHTTAGSGVNSQLAAAVAADAAGPADRAREHFAVAATEARDLPIRILQPIVLFWEGLSLTRRADATDHARGRAMMTAAQADFHRLEMVTHAAMAARFLAST